jgi:hypothetical protein
VSNPDLPTTPASQLTLAATQQVLGLLQGAPDAKKLESALRLLAKWRSELISNTMVAKSGDVVLAGPFAGMKYPYRASEGSRSARLLGAYEASLAPIIEKIVATDYRQVIDIGSAEGYYAVGLAIRMPKLRVLARDANPQAQALCKALAQINNVADRTEVGGLFHHIDFAVCETVKSLVICDIEGAEAELLDPILAPGLLAADILVEAHDCIRPGISDILRRRFAATHKIETIGRKLDDSALPAWMEGLSDLDRLLALWEWRGGPTPWLWMVKK